MSPIIFFNGATQAGKSTLMLHNLREIGKNGLMQFILRLITPPKWLLSLLLLKSFYPVFELMDEIINNVNGNGNTMFDIKR